MTLIRLCVDAINRLARLKRHPDQTPNAMMKTSIFGSSFGILVSVLIGTVQARDDGRYSQSPLKPWFDNLRSGKGPCCSDADGFLLQIRIGNPRAAIIVSASTTSGSTFPTMR